MNDVYYYDYTSFLVFDWLSSSDPRDRAPADEAYRNRNTQH